MTVIYGHRGAKGEVPENTLASFQQCLKHGVRRCELDLHLSRDGELMVIHDPTLKRTTGHRGKVVEHDAAELVTYDARRGGPSAVTPCPIPRLEELFQHCDFEHWQLEVKSASKVRSARMVKAIAELAERYQLTDKVTVTSSSREVLGALQRLTPHLQRGLVAEYAWLDPLKVAKHYGCHLLALNWTLCTPERLLKAQKQGLHVSVWTVNDAALMRRLADFCEPRQDINAIHALRQVIRSGEASPAIISDRTLYMIRPSSSWPPAGRPPQANPFMASSSSGNPATPHPKT